ncbi:MAG: 5'-methylthioadenosine/adenosylhomocysteine nucleosidase [Spirochaetales bacterium]|nr:5'-methylthioadenosine/adenosylhomocysteine nucleosidase [Spirochaetales bacterium]
MIGIIGAMEEEVRLLGEALREPRKITTGSLTFWTGHLENCSVVLVQSGIGKVNAAAACAVLIEKFGPEAVVNTGSAGGLSSGLALGDLVVAEALVHHDVDVTAFGYGFGQVPGLPASFRTDVRWKNFAERAFAALKKEKILPEAQSCVTGVIGSGDVFVHDPEKITALRARFPSVCAVEMEGAAIAQVCHLFQVPFLAIRSISDVAGKESPMKFEEFLPLASRHSAILVQRLLKEFQVG